MGDNKQIMKDLAAVLKNLKIKVTENSIVPLSEKNLLAVTSQFLHFPILYIIFL